MTEEKTLSELLDYIKRKKSLQDVDRNFPNWRDLLRDRVELSRLENFELDYHDTDPAAIIEIYEEILRAAGINLATLWASSESPFKRWVAENYFRTFTSPVEISVELWKNLTRKEKLQIISNIFENNPGEPFHFLKQIYFQLTSPDTIQFKRHRDVVLWFPSIGYVPSVEVVHLRSVIEQAGDSEFLKIIDSTLARYSQACERLTLFEGVLRYLYTYNSDERELIARSLAPFLDNGFKLAPLPPAFISFEPPPLFVGFPQLDLSLDKKVNIPFRIEDLVKEPEKKLIPDESRAIPVDPRRKKPDKIALEDILGIYQPLPEPRIIIFYEGLDWFGLDEVLVRYLTILHLVGHWIAHSLPCEKAPLWPAEKYLAVSKEVHETIAQLIAYWVVDSVGGELRETFDRLNGYLSDDYLKFKDFLKFDRSRIISSIKDLRNMDKPITMAEWMVSLKSEKSRD